MMKKMLLVLKTALTVCLSFFIISFAVKAYTNLQVSSSGSSGGISVEADTLQTVTNRGATSTKAIQFAGGTSTADFNVLTTSTAARVYSTTANIFQDPTFGYKDATGTMGFYFLRNTDVVTGNASSGVNGAVFMFNSPGQSLEAFAYTADPSQSNGTVAYALSDWRPFSTNFYDLGSSDLSWRGVYVSSTIVDAGTLVIGGSTYLGTDVNQDLVISASLASSIPIKTNNSFDIGSPLKSLAGIYVSSTIVDGGSLFVNSTTTLGNETSDIIYLTGSISSDIKVDQNNRWDIGSQSLSFKNIYASGTGNFFGGISMSYASDTNNTDPTLNAPRGTVRILASSSTVAVIDSYAKSTSHFNLTFQRLPSGGSANPVYIKSKDDGSFVLSLMQSATQDTIIDFEIVN